MGNMAVLGACVRLLVPDGLEFLEQAIAARMGAARRREHRRRARGLRALHEAAHARRRRAGRAAPAPRRRRGAGRSSRSARPTRCGNHTGLLVARPAGAPDDVHRVRACARSSARRARSRGATARWSIDYLYCKGCGICEVVCPVRNAIAMEEVRGMSQTLPHGRVVLTANEAAAYAVMLARAQAIGCYPITPQTLIVERLAELVAGRDDVEFANLESEHSMFGYVIAASRAGVRTFTATSSQGLLYAHEQLHRASRERVPLVVVNVNRAVFAPVEHRARPLGQHEPARHRLDPAVLLVGAGGARQRPLRLPDRRDGDAAGAGLRRGLPALAHVGGARHPGAGRGRRVHPGASPAGGLAARPGPAARRSRRCPSRRTTAAFQRNVAEAMDEARGVIADGRGGVRRALRAREGRRARGRRQPRRASTALVAIGTIGDTAQELLDDDDDLLVVRVHAYRPFPAAELAAVLAQASARLRRSTARPRSARSGRSAPT